MNGHKVRMANNGHVGLEELKRAHANQEFDLLITDIQMPVCVVFLRVYFYSFILF